MKKENKILLGISIIAATGLVIYAVRRYQSYRRYAIVADEGYETADDILFPDKKKKRKKTHYGPILPE